MLCGPHVLAIHRCDIHGLGLLCLMWMFGAGVDPEIVELLATKRSARQHALDSLLDHPFRETTLEDRPRRPFLDTADVAGVIVIDLALALAPGEHDLGGVDNDDVVAAVDM